jgi:hypothetical protein
MQLIPTAKDAIQIWNFAPCSCILLRVLVYYRLFKGGLLKTLPAFAEFGMKDLLPLKINRPDEGCIRSAMMFSILPRYRDTTELVKHSVRRGANFDRMSPPPCSKSGLV